ncbi:MAG: hypothetical protein V4724_26805 [Pseudomonadota bacterium]
MHEERIGASTTDQIVHYATALVDAREKRRAAKAANNQVEYAAARRKEHAAGLDLDRAVKRNRPP